MNEQPTTPMVSMAPLQAAGYTPIQPSTPTPNVNSPLQSLTPQALALLGAGQAYRPIGLQS
jgi:hypothetical protein